MPLPLNPPPPPRPPFHTQPTQPLLPPLCCQAFVKLEALAPKEQRQAYADLAMAIFVAHPPVDPRALKEATGKKGGGGAAAAAAGGGKRHRMLEDLLPEREQVRVGVWVGGAQPPARGQVHRTGTDLDPNPTGLTTPTPTASPAHGLPLHTASTCTHSPCPAARLCPPPSPPPPQVCVASGRSLRDAQHVRCKTCRHGILSSELPGRAACPLCHAALPAGLTAERGGGGGSGAAAGGGGRSKQARAIEAIPE